MYRIYLPIILAILCPQSIISEKVTTSKNVKVSNQDYSNFKHLNVSKYLGNTDINDATSIIDSKRKERNKYLDDYEDEIFSDKSSSNTLNVFINEASYANFHNRNNSSSESWKETVLKYLDLWEDWTRAHLRLQQSNSTQSTNQTVYLNLADINPIHIFCNFTNDQNTSSKFDDVYLCSNNQTLMNGNVKYSNEDVHLEYTYPPWKNLTKTEKTKFLQLAQGASLRHGKGAAIGLTLYYGILLVLGLPGNLLMCCIILANSYMMTAPNLFLFNIALADIFTLILGKMFFHK